MYLVASGLPTRLPRGHHARALAEFCVDVLRVLQSGLPAGVEPVTAKAGIHVGPVTAGLIGRTRRYYRVFGDTGTEISVSCSHSAEHTSRPHLRATSVNVASRMMSTGEAGRVQTSEATVRALLSIDEGLLPFSRPGISVECGVAAAPSGAAAFPLFIESRGLTAVKGKGLIPTYWVGLSPGAASSEMSALPSHRNRIACRAGNVHSLTKTAHARLALARGGSVAGRGAPALYLHRAVHGVYAGGVDVSMQSSLTGDSGTSPVTTPLASSAATPRSVHRRFEHQHPGESPVLLADAKADVVLHRRSVDDAPPRAVVEMPPSALAVAFPAANASPAQGIFERRKHVLEATAGRHALGLFDRVNIRAQNREAIHYPRSPRHVKEAIGVILASDIRRSPEVDTTASSVTFSRDNLPPGMVLGSSSSSVIGCDPGHSRCTRQAMPWPTGGDDELVVSLHTWS